MRIIACCENADNMSLNCTGTYESWFEIWFTVKVITLGLSIAPLIISISLSMYMAMKIRRPEKSNIDGKYATAINVFCLFSAFLSFLRLGLDFELILGNKSDQACTASMRAKNVLYISAVNAMYMILWLRQKVFYDNVALKHLRSIPVQVCSWCVLCFINGGALTMVILYLTTANYVTSVCGCVRIDKARVVKYGGGLAGTVLAQGALLGLLLYPLLKRQSSALKNSLKTNECKVARTFVKRACVVALICVVTDSICSVMGLTLGKSDAYHIVYEVNLIVNLVAVVCCFPDWRDRFLPCRLRRNTRDRLIIRHHRSIRVI